jgi:hypothetical protein
MDWGYGDEQPHSGGIDRVLNRHRPNHAGDHHFHELLRLAEPHLDSMIFSISKYIHKLEKKENRNGSKDQSGHPTTESEDVVEQSAPFAFSKIATSPGGSRPGSPTSGSPRMNSPVVDYTGSQSMSGGLRPVGAVMSSPSPSRERARDRLKAGRAAWQQDGSGPPPPNTKTEDRKKPPLSTPDEMQVEGGMLAIKSASDLEKECDDDSVADTDSHGMVKAPSRAARKSMVRASIHDLKLPTSGTGIKEGRSRAVFADAAEMKDVIRAQIGKKVYNVHDFYKTVGCAQAVARHPIFENFTLAVIFFNALWISVDTDLNNADLLADAEWYFQVAEHSFCTYFTFEWIVRFWAFKRKRDGLRDSWFVFDTFLFVFMAFETWLMTILYAIIRPLNADAGSGLGNTSVLKTMRLARLTRMARMVRLLRAVPELIILIKGIGVAARSVIFTLVLLVLIMYLFAITFRQLVSTLPMGTGSYLEDEYFTNVFKSMLLLFLDGVLPDQKAIVMDCLDAHWVCGVLILCFILLAALTVMNMLVGVLCEVVSVVSAAENESLAVAFVKQKMEQIFGELGLDEDGNNQISQREFEALLVRPDAANAIQEIGVDVLGLVDLSDFIFRDGIELSMEDFMELVLQLRGTNSATVKDVVDLRKHFIQELNDVMHDRRDPQLGECVSVTLTNGQGETGYEQGVTDSTNIVAQSVSGPLIHEIPGVVTAGNILKDENLIMNTNNGKLEIQQTHLQRTPWTPEPPISAPGVMTVNNTGTSMMTVNRLLRPNTSGPPY